MQIFDPLAVWFDKAYTIAPACGAGRAFWRLCRFLTPTYPILQVRTKRRAAEG